MKHALAIDAARLHTRLEQLNAINRREDNSCCRLALTDADRCGRDMVRGWMEDAGLQIQVDRIGNIIGLRPGARYGRPVMTGSHIDTVATGGPYDGAYGVLAGIEVIRTLNDAGIGTRHPLAVAVFTNEEGARFQPDMMGSLVFAGGLSIEAALAAESEDGAVLGEELARIGYAGSAPCGSPPRAFVELHIEQGPVLDKEGGALGAVQDLQGILWHELVIRGMSNHAGTTPMRLRHDAGYCAARISVFVRELAQRMGGSQVGTVGVTRLVPNLVNVIAREARITVDLRNTDAALLQQAGEALNQFVGELARAEGVAIEVRQLVSTPPVRFDEDLLATIESVAADLGHDIRRMTSGAGHDAQMIARMCPAAMIFVPSVGGISHNPREHTDPQHIELGANVLLHTMMRLAQ